MKSGALWLLAASWLAGETVAAIPAPPPLLAEDEVADRLPYLGDEDEDSQAFDPEEAEQAERGLPFAVPFGPYGIPSPDLTTEEPFTAPPLPARTPVLLPDTFPERLYDFFQRQKQALHIPVGAGAWHWQHVNYDGPNDTGYGIQGIRGTYFWYLLIDPAVELNSGIISKAGVHIEERLREQDQFRSFFPTKDWLWENYAYIQTPLGRFKGGKIWKRLGLDWDGTFWGNVPYFDGFKLDPDWGLSWEHTWKNGDSFWLDSFTQFFFHEDGVNGSVAGADPESVVGYNERNTGVLRLVPTWKLADDSVAALGLSGLVGQIHNAQIPGISDQVEAVWAVDLTWTKGRFKIFGEGLQSYGILNPTNYTTGGPSNRITNLLVGVHYQVGPALFRCSYSAGFDDNPSGWQELWVPGLTLALTKNVDFYLEYVRWNVNRTNTDEFLLFEDGFQMVINWRF